jgi:hypothetical protein
MPFINGAQGSTTIPPTTDAEYEYMIIEEGIQVPVGFLDAQASGAQAAYTTSFWPGGIVPYEFDGNVTGPNQTAMELAMREWEQVATVDFQECTNACSGDHIRIRDADANNSWIGRRGGEQIINIDAWGNRFLIAHELGHALAYWHEQARADRDTYVRINWANIINGQEGNFQIRSNGGEYGPYDFDSVMHYGQCTFAINCNGGANPTITVLPPNQAQQTRIGQLNHLSRMDRMTMSFLYPRSNWRFANINYGGSQSGNFLRPYQQATTGIINTPSGGILWVQPGTYSGLGTVSKPITIQAPLGGVTLRR